MNVNDLFQPGDEEAIRRAADSFSKNFLHASEILIDLRLLIYRLAALDQIFADSESDRDQKNLRSIYASRFRVRYTEMLSQFVMINADTKSALKKCHSEICVKMIADAERELLDFGQSINKKKNIKPNIKSMLLKASLEDTYAQIATDGSAKNQALVKGALAAFVSAVRGKSSSKSICDYGVETDKSLRSLHLKSGRLPNAVVRIEKEELDKIVASLIKSIVFGLPAEEVTAADPKSLSRVHLLGCYMRGSDDLGFDLGVYGKGPEGIKCVEFVNNNAEYGVEIRDYGPGLAVGGGGWFVVVILSPVEIETRGQWVGPKVSAGALFVGPTASILFGEYGSTAMVLGLNVPHLGVFAGMSSFKLK